MTEPVHLATLVRTALLWVAATYLLFALQDRAWSSPSEFGVPASIPAALAGLVVWIGVGRAAALDTWHRGADAGTVLASVALGGLLGWLVFPGAPRALDLAASGAPPSAWAGLGTSLALGQVCLTVGAGLAKRSLARPRLTGPSRRRPYQRPAGR